MKKRSPYADAGAVVAASAGVDGPSRLRKRPKSSAVREAEWFADIQRQWAADKSPVEAGTAAESAETEAKERGKAAQHARGGRVRREKEAQSRQEHKRPQMSAADLEQKKTLLPYLDDIEYINVQLRMRGLLPDEEPAAEPHHARNNTRTPVVAWDETRSTPAHGQHNHPSKSPQAKGMAKPKASDSLALPAIHGPLPTNQDDGLPSDTDPGASADLKRLSIQVLRARYPRFVEALQLAPTTRISPRVRLVAWLLHLIEDVYNNLFEGFTVYSSATGTDNGVGAKLVMPFLARRFIHHALGLRELADQECADLMLNVELRRDQFPEVATFSLFLRELLDEDHLLFFLLLRYTLQAELDLNLASKEKRAHTSTLGRKYASDALVHTRDHPLLPDGTQQVLLSSAACEKVMETVFTAASRMNPSNHGKLRASPLVLAQFVVRVKFSSLFGRKDPPVLEDFMGKLIQTFQEIDEDIIAMFKYNDDGESLISLIRLRDTIASEAKIQAWTTSYSEQEKLLRNLRIEEIRMERNNADNRFRVELRLLQHRIHLQEQELEHIQQQITSAQATVDNVWQAVVKKGRPHSEPETSGIYRLAQNGGSRPHPSPNRVDKELASVLGRFEAYIAKLHQKHSITVKAANVLAAPWQRQVEEYRVRMVIRIQRAYRARTRTREIKLDAREKLKEQIRERDVRLRNEQLEKQRLQALQAKELERHQMRLRAKQDQEAKLKAEQDERQRAIVDRVRANEVARMQLERDKRVVSRMWSKWWAFIGGRRQKRKANAMFLKLTLLKWKRHFAAFQRVDTAARVIQSAVRHRQKRLKFRKELRYQAKRNALAKKYLQKVQRRVVVRLFNHWAAHCQQQQTLRANFAQIIQKREGFWLTRWSEFVNEQKQARDTAARLVQRLYRGRLARRLFQYCRHRNRQVLVIQRVYRGYRSRSHTAKVRQVKAHQDAEVSRIRTRIQHRAMGMCLWGLQRYAIIEGTVKAMESRRRDARKRVGVLAFSINAVDEKEARAALERLQYESASCIQRQFRRHLCQRVFREQIRLYRAARSIQRVYRGYRGRQAAKRLRWEIESATRIQTAWRRYRARALVHSLRIERILAAAFRGDYAVIKCAIAGGYWYATDAEGNGILHMAAAASHKRIVKLCLRCSFNIEAVNAQQQTPLHLVLANLPPSLNLLPGDVDDVPDDPNVRVRADRLALAEYLIDHGAWQEAPDVHGLTPLLLSASLGHADAVDMLLDRGANTEARTIIGQLNAVQLAVEGNHYETLRVLLASRAYDPAPYTASVTSETDYEAEVYAEPPATWLQLHACAGRGLLDSLRVLLDHIQSRPAQYHQGVVERRDREGYTPLIYAVNSKSPGVVQLLLERGAGPDVKDYFGRAPLHFALQASSADRENGGDGITTPTSCLKVREEIVRLLTMFDADVNVKDTDSDMPLHMSCQSDALLGCSSLLLASGAVLAANAIGNHPTHVAAQSGAIATLRLLLDYGGDINLKNYAGKTPLGVARMHGQLAVVEFVREYFAQESIEAVDDDEREDVRDIDAEGIHDNDRGKDEGYNGEELEEADGFDAGEVAGSLRERTPDEWASALATASRMDTLAEWTMFIDDATGTPFYANFSSNDDGVVCTWDPSVEFDAALGMDWEIVRCPPGWSPPVASLNVHHDHDHRRGALVADAPVASMNRSVTEWKYLYHHRVTGELRTQAPPVDLALLQDVVQRSKRHQMLLRARVQRAQDRSNDVSASAVEYLRFSHAFAAESAEARAEHLAAVAIQRRFRARRTLRLVRLMLLQNRRAVDLQQAFRARRARLRDAALDHRRASATTIQAAWRGFSTRRREHIGGPTHTERVRFRHCLRAAMSIQRVFRGFAGRRKALWEALRRHVLLRRFSALSLQPPKSVTDWHKLCLRSKQHRSFMVWDEFRAPRELLYLPFYCHTVTRLCSWEQSVSWQEHDRQAFEARKQLWAWGYTTQTVQAARALQRLWRARVARVALRAVLSAVRLMRRCERAYLEEPTSLVALGNYVLFLHAVTHDYERARPLFARLLRAMVQRGPDVPFVLFAYALFAYITQEVDAREAGEFISRAKARDPKIASFQVALLGFFRPQVLVNPQSCEANVNYAACLQWLVVSDARELSQLETAQEYYMRALAADPRRRGAMELLQDVLNRKRSIIQRQRPPRRKQDRKNTDDDDGADFDGHEVFRRWQAAQAAREDQERTRALLEQQERDARRAAAIKIQARYRRRRAQRQTRRLQQELRQAAAHAEQAKERAVHDFISRAFDAVGAAAGGKTKAKAALSLPVKQLEAVFTAIVGRIKSSGGDADASTPEELSPSALAAAFTRTRRGVKHANVLDLCRFVHATPTLEVAITQGM